MTPTPGDWQELVDAIKQVAPDPFWSTAIPILTTLFAVFGGFALAQWRESAKGKREQREKRHAVVRKQRANLVGYLTRWSHGTDGPWKHRGEFAYARVATDEVNLLISLTNDPEDAPLAQALGEFMTAWVRRTYAAQIPEDEVGGIDYQFLPSDIAEMEKFRMRLLAILRQWLDTTISPSKTSTEMDNLAQDILVAAAARKASFDSPIAS